MKPRHLMMGVALLAAAWLALVGDKTPSSGLAAPVTRPVTPRASGAAGKASTAPAVQQAQEPTVVIAALQPRDTLIGGAHATVPAEGLFASQTWTPPPPPPPKPPPPPPPSAPPLPFTYLGKKRENGQWEVYLARNEQTFVVQEKTVIDGTYRVDAVKPPTLSLTYLPLSQAQTLTIGDPD